MEGNMLQQSLIFLSAAVVCVPIARKLGMGSVLGYLIAGMLIGPFVLGFVGEEGQDIMHTAEFGVVIMLFLIGLELNPKEFWEMRRSILGLGSIQIGLSSLILGALGHLVMGWTHPVSLAIALAVSMSSTAIVLQTLKEKGLSKSTAGQAGFSVLLFQDIMVIPILALLPLLAGSPQIGQEEASSLFAHLPAWLRTLSILLSVGVIYVAGRYLVSPLLRIIARTHLRELFTASALLLVIGVAYLMQLVGLSPALGTFMAGVVLANSEYRHELESDLQPFKALLLGLFFIAVGATINFGLIIREPLSIFGIVIVLMLIKSAILFLAGRIFKLKSDQNLLFALMLSQIGEFAFVIFNFGFQLQIFDRSLTELLMAATAISMTITPLLLLINERWIDPYFGTKEVPVSKPHDVIEEQQSVIIAGFGHFGSTIGRLLRANGVKTIILDNDSDRVEVLRKMGFKVYYGDATRVDLLRAAGADNARTLIAAIDSPEINQILIETVRKNFPGMRIFARARNRMDAYDLMDAGVKDVYRETLYTAVHLAVDVLSQNGLRRYTALRKGQEFIRYDEAAMERLASFRHDMKEYILNAREQIEIQEKLLLEDQLNQISETDASWDSDPLKKATA